MSEWKYYKLGDIVDFQNGFAFKSSNFRYDGKYKIIRIKELKNGSVKFFEDTVSVSDDSNETMSKFLVNKGDVIFALTGDPVSKPNPNSWVGRVSLYTHKEPAYLNQRTCKITQRGDVVPQYVFYYFRLYDNFYSLASKATGSASQANISTKTLEDTEIKLPSMKVQNEIVNILSMLDEKIETNRKINARLEELAQALFKSWFIDFEPFGGKMPEDWTTSAAENFFTIDIGKTPPRKETQWFSCRNNDVAWISISDMGKSGMFISTSSEMITEDAKTKFNIVTVPKNTILLSFKLTIGRVSIANTELTTNEAIARFRLNNFIEREFLYLFLKEYDYNSLGSTSSIAVAVNSKIIKRMPITMPTKQVLYEFSMLVCPLFDRIESLTKESARLAELRDTLLPKLMSGEIIPE